MTNQKYDDVMRLNTLYRALKNNRPNISTLILELKKEAIYKDTVYSSVSIMIAEGKPLDQILTLVALDMANLMKQLPPDQMRKADSRVPLKVAHMVEDWLRADNIVAPKSCRRR